MLFDKTGTLTRGDRSSRAGLPAGGVTEDELLRLAASVEQVLAPRVARGDRPGRGARGLVLGIPSDVQEAQGAVCAVRSTDNGGGRDRRVRPWPPSVGGEPSSRRADLAGQARVAVAIDGTAAGALVLADPVRPDAGRAVRSTCAVRASARG